MPRRSATLPLALPPHARDTPAYRWVCDAVRSEILAGRLRPGARLPATRDLAGQLGVARGTIVVAFAQLESEGYVTGRTGSGTFVNRVLPDALLTVRRASGPPAQSQAPRIRPLSDFARRAPLLPGFGPGPVRAFRCDQPALDLFPTALWARLAARRLRKATSRQLLECGPLGYRPLQEAVADYLTTSRGVRCEPAQVAIVAGMQEILALVAAFTINPGDTVCIEDPGYRGASMLFAALGARVRDVPVDEEGMRPPPRGLRRARLAYCTPGHQFPLGIAMSPRRRLELLAWARDADALLMEDDYDSEYRYEGRPIAALQSLDRDGRVLFAGSFSKVLFPALRLGYLVVPPDLVDVVARVRSVTTRHAPVLEQAVVADFIAQGHFGRHVRRMREVYAERRTALLEAARRSLGGLLEFSGVEAGLQTAAWLPPGVTGARTADRLAERDVDVTPLSRYYRGVMPRDGLQLGFAAVGVTELRRGVEELARVLPTH